MAKQDIRQVRGIKVVLRRGYSLRAPGMSEVIFGPAEIVVDEKTARLNMHKWENPSAVREALGLPPRPERVVPQPSVPLDLLIQRAEEELTRLKKRAAETKEPRR